MATNTVIEKVIWWAHHVHLETIETSSLGQMTSQATGFQLGLQYKKSISSYGPSTKSNQRAVGYPHNELDNAPIGSP